ncbi:MULTISPECIES: MFS transporter [Actinoalloteichus]|uniref:MFS transporter n=2 Tax=Pseudonocardiaceae TaxID=2070 RepID=UPI0004151C72
MNAGADQSDPTPPSTTGGVEPRPPGGTRLLMMLVRTRAGFRRLLISRFTAQWGDGIFQAGLGSAVLFNPEREADPAVVAAGLAVLLLPYSVVGPFAGALLDRWDRRRVLLTANLVRGALIVLTSAAVAAGVAGAPLYAGALLVMGVSRFVGAGLSASLPHVVAPGELVPANAAATTLGAAVTAIGAGSAIVLREVLGAGDAGSALVTVIAAAGSLVAALVLVGFSRGALGPGHEPTGTSAADGRVDPPPAGAAARPGLLATLAAVAGGLRDGGRTALSVPSVTAGFLALISHRAAFGVVTLTGLLLMRHGFTDLGPFRAGLLGVGQVVGAAAAGIVVGALLTPRLVARHGARGAVRGALLGGAATMLLLGIVTTLPTLLLASFLVGLAGQVVKLCADAAVQRDIVDEHRGRVFALYDTLFNVMYVAAIAAAATVAPLDGRSPALLFAAAGLYLLGLVGHGMASRRAPEDGPGGGGSAGGAVEAGDPAPDERDGDRGPESSAPRPTS